MLEKKPPELSDTVWYFRISNIKTARELTKDYKKITHYETVGRNQRSPTPLTWCRRRDAKDQRQEKTGSHAAAVFVFIDHPFRG